MGSCYLTDIVSLLHSKKVLGMCCPTNHIVNTSAHLKMVKMVNFVVFFFNHKITITKYVRKGILLKDQC